MLCAAWQASAQALFFGFWAICHCLVKLHAAACRTPQPAAGHPRSRSEWCHVLCRVLCYAGVLLFQLASDQEPVSEDTRVMEIFISGDACISIYTHMCPSDNTRPMALDILWQVGVIALSLCSSLIGVTSICCLPGCGRCAVSAGGGRCLRAAEG